MPIHLLANAGVPLFLWSSAISLNIRKCYKGCSLALEDHVLVLLWIDAAHHALCSSCPVCMPSAGMGAPKILNWQAPCHGGCSSKSSPIRTHLMNALQFVCACLWAHRYLCLHSGSNWEHLCVLICTAGKHAPCFQCWRRRSWTFCQASCRIMPSRCVVFACIGGSCSTDQCSIANNCETGDEILVEFLFCEPRATYSCGSCACNHMFCQAWARCFYSACVVCKKEVHTRESGNSLQSLLLQFLAMESTQAVPCNIGLLARAHADVTLLFMDICGFTAMSKVMESMVYPSLGWVHVLQVCQVLHAASEMIAALLQRYFRHLHYSMPFPTPVFWHASKHSGGAVHPSIGTSHLKCLRKHGAVFMFVVLLRPVPASRCIWFTHSTAQHT